MAMEPEQLGADPNELARRLRQMNPRRVRKLLDELGLDDPSKGLEFDPTRYDVLTLAPLAFEAECHVLRVETIVERVSIATPAGSETGLQPILQQAIANGRKA